MNTMRAMGTLAPGSELTLVLQQVPLPQVAAGTVRVRVQAAAVNPADLKIVRGVFLGRFMHARVRPLVPGYDYAGTIDAVGEGVAGLSAGMSVFGHLAYSGATRQGSFAEAVVVDPVTVAPVPAGVAPETAAAAATVGLTALQALRDAAALGPGQRLLLLGASGGVGSLAVGVAKRLGAHVTAVCSTYALQQVRQLGADAVVDRQIQDPLRHGQAFDVVFDTTGLYAYAALRRLLTPRGVFVTTLPSPTFVLGKLLTFASGRNCRFVVVRSRRDDLTQLGAWLAGGLVVPIAGRYPVREATQALRRLAEGSVPGKIVLDVAGGF